MHLPVAVALAIAILIGSTITALHCLGGRLGGARSPTEDIQLQWDRYRKRDNYPGEFITAIAQNLIGEPGERTAIIDLRDAADRRGSQARCAPHLAGTVMRPARSKPSPGARRLVADGASQYACGTQ